MDFDDLVPKKKTPAHEIGCDLSAISVAELEHRIAALQAEIARLQAEIAAKSASKNAADAFFKK